MNDRPVAETSVRPNTTFIRDRYPRLPEGFESAVRVSDQLQNLALDCSGPGVGGELYSTNYILKS